MKNRWTKELLVRFRWIVRPYPFNKLDIEHFCKPIKQTISDDLDKWDITSCPPTYLNLLEITICILWSFTLVFLAHIETSKFSYNLEHNNKHIDMSLYIVSTSYHYEPVGFDCTAVMTNVSSDSLFLDKRFLRQKCIFRPQCWVHRHQLWRQRKLSINVSRIPCIKSIIYIQI